MVRSITALAFASLVFTLGCGGSEDSNSGTPAKPTPAEAPAPAKTAKPAPTPPPAQAAKEGCAQPGIAAKGKPVYVTFCASCHGEDGAADGPMAAALNPKPAQHNDGAYMNALSDEHLFKVVKLGGPAVGKSPLMAGWGGSINDAQICDIIAFMRSIADPPYQP